MRLRYAPNSPFVRKVMVTAIENGLDGKIEKIPTDINVESDLSDQNPLGKVPTLLLDDGTVLIESTLICAHLDDGKLIPRDAKARSAALQLQAYADGLCEAAINVSRERGRPEDIRWAAAEARQRLKFERTMDLLEREAEARLAGAPDIGQVALGCALGWVDLRLGDFEWRRTRPKLAKWYADLSRRPSMAATAPPAPKP